jgi:hypothetical protein
MLNKTRKTVGSFRTEDEAKDALKIYLNNIANEEMPPRRRQQQAEELSETYTLSTALEFISTKLNNPDSTKKLYKRCLITFTRFAVDEKEELEEDEELNLDELVEIYGEIDLVPLLTDFERTKEVVETEIKNSRTGEDIAIDTKKQYYSAFLALFLNVEGRLFVGKEVERLIQARLDYWNIESNKKRRLLLPKDYAVEDPLFTYEVMEKEYTDFLATKKFSNNKQGRKDLRHAVVVGLYMLQPPRRVEDYWKLQYHSKEPTEAEQKDKNILWLRKEEGETKGTFYIDKFKTRWQVRKNKRKEVLPRYIKELNGRLASLFTTYLHHFKINDMSKLSAQDKRDKKNYYIFFPDGQDPSVPYPNAGGYGKVVVAGMRKIFKQRAGLSTNAFRHNFNHWISRTLEKYDDEKLKDIAIDVGDTWKEMPTNLRYRFADPNNTNLAAGEVIGQVKDDDYAKALMTAEAEEEGSVAGDAPPRVEDIDRMDTIDEVDEAELVEVDVGGKENVNDVYAKLGEVEAKIVALKREKERLLKMLLG